MATVTSLGLHKPTGLQYAIQEGLLPHDPPANTYTWQIHSDSAGRENINDVSLDDELLVTPRCVIWSRGGVFRKSYNFDLEKEQVSQALLTTFPSVGPLVSRNFGSEVKHAPGRLDARSPAIVVFLQTQAHVYFLTGTSHVIHLPFEIESAIAAPRGIILQRKLQTKSLVTASLKMPQVPPNSFISPQLHQPWSPTSSIQSTFSIADLGSLKSLPFAPKSSLNDMWEPPAPKNDANWARLFSLMDPLAEVGLIVAQPSKKDNRGDRRKSVKLSTLDTSEEIVYVSHEGEFSKLVDHQSLVLAVTLNRDTSMYTVWKLSYIGDGLSGRENKRVPSGTMSRRRSSFMPGTGTGATTPVQNLARESLSGNPQPSVVAKGSKADDQNGIKAADFVASLDPEFDNPAIPRRKSRRVSSMLARADLSASHERSAFSDLASGLQHSRSKRGESLSSQHVRTSMAGHSVANGQSFSQPHFNHSISSHLEAPVDELLEELRAGGDFEGFDNMGLEDEVFDALKQEIVLTEVCSVPTEYSNLRYSTQSSLAKNQCKVFTLIAPPSETDEQQGSTILVCILDPGERKLLLLTLRVRKLKTANIDSINLHSKAKNVEKDVTAIQLSGTNRPPGVIDACRLDDGEISRILVLTETTDGYGELSLQAPWTSVVMKITLPEKFATSNIRDLNYESTQLTKREAGLKRVLSEGPRGLSALCNVKPRGLFDLVDTEGKKHQLQVRMQPQNPLVLDAIGVIASVVTGYKGGESFLGVWWNAMQWLRLEAIEAVDMEWTAFVVALFSMVLSLGDMPSPSKKSQARKKPRAGFLRSSSGAQHELVDWHAMQSQEISNGNSSPSWAGNRGWQWLDADDSPANLSRRDSDVPSQIFASSEKDNFIKEHVRLSRTFLTSSYSASTLSDCFITYDKKASIEVRVTALTNAFIALHLFREEQKLDIMRSDALTTGTSSLTPVLAQIARWLRWQAWVAQYDIEESSLIDAYYDGADPFNSSIPEPYACPLVYEWIQKAVTHQHWQPFMTLSELVKASDSKALHLLQWRKLTPRTLMFFDFFLSLREALSPVEFVEALAVAGMNSLVLETLPEAVIALLQEAIVRCQAEPPTKWSKELLAIVGREDVNMLLVPGQRPRQIQTALLAPSHEASSDVHTICVSTNDLEATGAFDGSAEIERQAITRAIFKDDRRMNEAMNILNTFRPTVARCKAEPFWTESELLEAQKEHAQMLAYRTLAISSGRGLIYYSARIPLLTQRFPIGGFNLSCVMKPDNNTVGVDKNAFTEEKVCWAFFHSGVAAGLGISRNAKGIDTSWILFNKPLQDLSNRHAGFLLALGLNGHLKSVAKWVAFKYLTPKHTMTSIGLLLGLATSYIGTMDSLVTRLLSVHVTRMLPIGAAELNLSPLTQATGIMGIGILYCDTQHRRMSEIMVSEIEHIDNDQEEDVLRNEGYRLAAGFALGFINLGKGADLKGLHDMRLTERLLTLAVGTKQVDLVHVLDKATAAAVVAFALIFMKSENKILARKIDVPDSVLQFDYVRPDIFLLRTLAKHLIMWSQIVPSFLWINSNLPLPYRTRSKLEKTEHLTSDDLPFYNIIAGLCWSISLRFAGSGNIVARDVLIHYLDQFMRICEIEANTFDKKLTRNTVRNCQDLVSLAVSTVMAGTGDLAVLRRLRSLHGRDDKDTPYGSHLAAHLAVGALFLGGGTFTFGTSNLAIAALIVAFYPLFPSTVQDNKSHLQAFRHFWVLATEARCLVARDIDTNQPVSLPITITTTTGDEIQRHTPCLLPESDQVANVRTQSTEYWNIVLDFKNNPAHNAAFKATQTIYVRRRPAHDASAMAFQATLQALNEVNGTSSHSLEWLFELPAFATLTKAERALVIPPDRGGASDVRAGTTETVVDTRLVLEHATIESGKQERLLGLRLLFEWADGAARRGEDGRWIRSEVIERLKAKVWGFGLDVQE